MPAIFSPLLFRKLTPGINATGHVRPLSLHREPESPHPPIDLHSSQILPKNSTFKINNNRTNVTRLHAIRRHPKTDKPKVELLVQTSENGQPELVGHAQIAESSELIFQCRIKSNPPVIQTGWIFKNKPLINDARNGELPLINNNFDLFSSRVIEL